jgi:hypothetical protein
VLHMLPDDEEHTSTWRCPCNPIVVPVFREGGRMKPAYWHLGEPWDGRVVVIDDTGQQVAPH